MAVVIRLQGLPVVAGSSDIRRFFSGLNIPDGGVHIIGGDKGEAFTIFATDEDARQGMSFSGGLIKDSRIELFLSSKTEMQNRVDVNRKIFDHGGRETGTVSRQAGSSNSGVGSLSNLVAAIRKGIDKSTCGTLDHLEEDFHSVGSHNNDTELSKSASNLSKKELFNSDNVYVYIHGLPYSATEDDVLNFFSGLQVEELVLLENKDGRPSGKGMLKFATSSDATVAVQRNREYMGDRFIEVRPSNERAWLRYSRKNYKNIDKPFKHFAQLNKDSSSCREPYSGRESSYMSSRKQSHSRSPPRRAGADSCSTSPPRRYLTHSHSKSPSKRFLSRSHSRSASRRYLARSRSTSAPRRYLFQSGSRSPSRRAVARSRSPLSPSTLPHSSNRNEFYIHIKNLSPAVEKRDLRVFFGVLDIPSHHITLWKPHNNYEKKREALVLFRSYDEYQIALTYHKESLFGQEVLIFPTSKKSVSQICESSGSKRSERHHHAKEKRDGCSGQKTCVYVRNLPFDVTKVEVQKFFAGFNIDDSGVHLLYDEKGIGLGEALVRFHSEDQARKAESLNHRRFLGTSVLLRCIPEEQMQDFGINISSMSSEKMQAYPHAHSRSEHFHTFSSQGPPMQGNLIDSSDFMCSDDFLCSPDRFGGFPPFPDFCSEGHLGGFPEGHLMPDSNFSMGSDSITMIKLKNMPFRASPNEILDFFHGYKIIPESLSIQNNDYGMPSGEATLALVNYDEAVAAVNELNGRPFGHRKVRLTIE
ncbi:RNA-binding protein 12B-like [Paroedura picta]|uniref:RNA-binding protein 12B-like n=1 Tax=Paroedura picta TaxID=143630 RepID=UPI001015C843